MRVCKNRPPDPYFSRRGMNRPFGRCEGDGLPHVYESDFDRWSPDSGSADYYVRRFVFL